MLSFPPSKALFNESVQMMLRELHTSQIPSKVRLSKLLSNPERVLTSVSLTNHLLNLIVALLIITLPWKNDYFALVSGEMLLMRSAIALCRDNHLHLFPTEDDSNISSSTLQREER